MQSILHRAFAVATSQSNSPDQRRHAGTATDSASSHITGTDSIFVAAYSRPEALTRREHLAARDL